MTSSKNILSSDTHIVGNITFSDELLIEGSIDGNIISQNGILHIGPSAQIKGEVRTRSVIVQGRVEGKIAVADRCELRETCEVVADVHAAALAMVEGAVLVGSSKIAKQS